MAYLWTCVLCFCIVTVVCQGRSVDRSMIDGHRGGSERPATTGHLDYCNTRAVHGHEGQVMPGYSLQSVHIVMSPGQIDVSSHTKIKGHNFSPLPCNQDTSSRQLLDLKQSVTSYSSSPRSHPDLRQFQPWFPNLCSRQHLTEQGFQQLANIGTHLHSSYLANREHKHLLPKYKSVRVETSYTQPSFQSALGLLHSLLPQKHFQKTKIHKAKRTFCDHSESRIKSCECSTIKELTPHMSQALGAGRFMFKPSFPDIETVQKEFDLGSDSDISSLQLLQLLMQYECNHISPSCNGSSLCVPFTAEKLSTLYRLTTKYLHSVYTDSIFRTYSEMRAYPFLQQLVARTHNTVVNETMFLYIGDQFFLQYLRTSLTILPEEFTPLASRLVIEVYKKNYGHVDGGRRYFKVIYNGRDLTRQVADCRFHMENDLCPFDVLTSLVNLYRNQYIDKCER